MAIYAAAASMTVLTGFTSLAMEQDTAGMIVSSVQEETDGWEFSDTAGQLHAGIVLDMKETAREAQQAYIEKVEEERRAAEEAQRLAEEKAAEIEERILPLLPHDPEPAKVKSFDILVFTVEAKIDEYLESGKDARAIRHGFQMVSDDFTRRMEDLLKLKSIPDVLEEEKLIIDMIDGAYLLDDYSLERAEYVRNELRDLMQYIPDRQEYYVIDLPDVLIQGESSGGIQGKTYVDRYEDYLRNDSNIALSKLRTLEPLTPEEKAELRDAFTKRLGTEAEYAAWSDNAPLLPHLRKRVGISEDAIASKLGPILRDQALDDEQRAFMEQVIEYARVNGDVEAKTLLQTSPFDAYDLNGLFGASFPLLKQLLDALHKPVVE